MPKENMMSCRIQTIVITLFMCVHSLQSATRPQAPHEKLEQEVVRLKKRVALQEKEVAGLHALMSALTDEVDYLHHRLEENNPMPTQATISSSE